MLHHQFRIRNAGNSALNEVSNKVDSDSGSSSDSGGDAASEPPSGASCTCDEIDRPINTDPGISLTVSEFVGANTIRPCHYAYMRDKSGKLMKIQVMYDTGSDLSQITEFVISQCGIKPIGILPELRMYVAGAKKASSMGRSELHSVPLLDKKGKLVMEIKCVTVPYIGKTRKATVSDVLEQFEPRQCTGLLEPSYGMIHLLIGSNHAQYMPSEIVVNESVVLARTRFGAIIYGSHASFPTGRQVASADTNSAIVTLSLQLACTQLAVSKLEPGSFMASCRSARDNSQTLQQCGENSKTSANCAKSRGQSESDRVTDKPLRNGDAKLGSVVAVEETDEENSAYPVSETVSCERFDPGVQISSLAQNDRDEFDRMVEIEEQATCFRCGKCPLDMNEKSRENQRRMEMYRDCLVYDPTRKLFVAKMPWTQDYTNLPDNKASALRRLQSLTKSMMKDEELKQRYIAEFEKSISDGILVQVTDVDDEKWKSDGGRVWYLSHFCVLNEASSSTPLRIVFDSSVSYRGVLINQYLEAPPNLVPQIPNLIIRFRERPVTLCLDIRRAYWAVHLDTVESHMHRVLWNALDPEQQERVFRIVRNCWGLRPSGSICSLAMLMIAERCREQFPDVYEFIALSMYVDDGTFSCETFEEALSLARNINYVMTQASFEVKYFVIGGKSIDVTVVSEGTDLPENVRFGEDRERILGIHWVPANDTLTYSARMNFSKKKRGKRCGADVTEENFDRDFPQVLTRRMYLQMVAGIFDPTGLVTPYTIMLKCELGRIFLLEQGWDDAIPHGEVDSPEASYERCKYLLRMVYELASIEIPRCLRPIDWDGSKPSLVTFCDSSQVAYAACVYYNWNTGNGQRLSRLVLAKARPFPKRQIVTIPRGELLAAQMGVRLAKTVLESSTYEFENVVYLTDSTIVLGQIATSPAKLKIWPARKVEEIQLDSNPDQWYHVSSQLNVADHATRGLSPCHLGGDTLWQDGSVFMAQDFETWPVVPIKKINSQMRTNMDVSKMELRSQDPRMTLDRSPTVGFVRLVGDPEVLLSSQQQTKDRRILDFLFTLNIPDAELGDSWYRLRRKVARIIHWCENLPRLYLEMVKNTGRGRVPSNFLEWSRRRQREWINENDPFSPSVREMHLAKIYWLMRYQKMLPKGVEKSLKNVNPKLGPDGLWYAVGRLPSIIDSPVLLPNCELAKVILWSYHATCHAGGRGTNAQCRREFWIVNGQRLANSIIRSCCRCNFLRKVIPKVEIAPVKEYHTRRYPVFQIVTLDIAGPYHVKPDLRATRSTVTAKVWVLVIVCCASKATHIEIMEAYDTASFLDAFETFCDFRAIPSMVIADRGSQVVSASNVLESVWASIDKNELLKKMADKIEWKFVPSGAHSAIGVAERTIRSFKETMNAMAYSKSPVFSKLRFARLLYSIANVMNRRPLALRNVDVAKLSEDNLITPNDLLLGRSSAVIDPLIEEKYLDIVSKQEYIGIMKQKRSALNQFWTVWQHVVYPSLMERQIWHTSGRELHVHDIVLVKDTNPIRGKFTWGEITEVKRSNDGRVRSATVRYTDVLFKRRSEEKTKSVSKYVIKSVRDMCLLMPVEERQDLGK